MNVRSAASAAVLTVAFLVHVVLTGHYHEVAFLAPLVQSLPEVSG